MTARELLAKTNSIQSKIEAPRNRMRVKNNKRTHIDKIIANLEKFVESDLKASVSNMIYKPSYKNQSIAMKKLVNIHNHQRPFINEFIDYAYENLSLPKSIKNPKASFKEVKLDFEDEANALFAEVMHKNKLGLKPLIYREGIPLVRDGVMIKNIHWKLK